MKTITNLKVLRIDDAILEYVVGYALEGEWIKKIEYGFFGDFGFSFLMTDQMDREYLNYFRLYSVLIAEYQGKYIQNQGVETYFDWQGDDSANYYEAYREIAIPIFDAKYTVGVCVNGNAKITDIRRCVDNNSIEYYACFDCYGNILVRIDVTDVNGMNYINVLEECEPNDSYKFYDGIRASILLCKLSEAPELTSESLSAMIAALEQEEKKLFEPPIHNNRRSDLIYDYDCSQDSDRAIQDFTDLDLKVFMFKNVNSQVLFMDDKKHIYYATIRGFERGTEKDVCFYRGDSKSYAFKTIAFSYENSKRLLLNTSIIRIKKVFVLGQGTGKDESWNYKEPRELFYNYYYNV